VISEISSVKYKGRLHSAGGLFGFNANSLKYDEKAFCVFAITAHNKKIGLALYAA